MVSSGQAFSSNSSNQNTYRDPGTPTQNTIARGGIDRFNRPTQSAINARIIKEGQKIDQKQNRSDILGKIKDIITTIFSTNNFGRENKISPFKTQRKIIEKIIQDNIKKREQEEKKIQENIGNVRKTEEKIFQENQDRSNREEKMRQEYEEKLEKRINAQRLERLANSAFDDEEQNPERDELSRTAEEALQKMASEAKAEGNPERSTPEPETIEAIKALQDAAAAEKNTEQDQTEESSPIDPARSTSDTAQEALENSATASSPNGDDNSNNEEKETDPSSKNNESSDNGQTEPHLQGGPKTVKHNSPLAHIKRKLSR